MSALVDSAAAATMDTSCGDESRRRGRSAETRPSRYDGEKSRQAAHDAVVDGRHGNVVACAGGCGELYASAARRDAHVARGHAALCVGKVPEDDAENDPRVAYRVLAAASNDILLLVADVAAAVPSPGGEPNYAPPSRCVVFERGSGASLNLLSEFRRRSSPDRRRDSRARRAAARKAASRGQESVVRTAEGVGYPAQVLSGAADRGLFDAFVREPWDAVVRGARAEILLVGSDFATYFTRTARAVRRCQN